jgi:hypothetical protein
VTIAAGVVVTAAAIVVLELLFWLNTKEPSFIYIEFKREFI